MLTEQTLWRGEKFGITIGKRISPTSTVILPDCTTLMPMRFTMESCARLRIMNGARHQYSGKHARQLGLKRSPRFNFRKLPLPTTTIKLTWTAGTGHSLPVWATCRRRERSLSGKRSPHFFGVSYPGQVKPHPGDKSPHVKAATSLRSPRQTCRQRA